MNPLWIAALVVQVLVAEPQTLRCEAFGVAGERVEWVVDGIPVGNTTGAEVKLVAVGPGPHAIVARTTWTGPWSIAARADPPVDAVAFVESTTASHEAQAPLVIPTPPLAAALALLLLAAVAARSKGP